MSVLVYQQRVIGGGGGGSSSPGGSVITISTEDEELFGQTVTLSKGTYTKSAVFSNEGIATVTGFEKTGTINVTVGEITKTMDIPYYGEYAVEVQGKAFYEAWLESINHSTEGYESLNDVLADEKLLRELFTRHASVDFLVDNSEAEELSTIINNDYCAKWINLRDYALDTLYANETIAALMDTADKYFYGEWALMPQVPVMTSDTAPYGEASASSVYGNVNFKPYKAFDGSKADCWATLTNYPIDQWIMYHFINPVKINQVLVANRNAYNSGAGIKDFKIQASNDNSTWVDLGTFEHTQDLAGYSATYSFDNDTEYSYYRLYIITNHGHSELSEIGILQFYAWQPKGNVPVMTSNTAPYGEASASSTYSSRSTYMAFKDEYAYGKNWLPTTTSTGHWLRYKFTNPVIAKKISINFYTEGWVGSSINFKIQASNDTSNWVDLTEALTISNVESKEQYYYICPVTKNDNYYLYYQIYFVNQIYVSAQVFLAINSLQFYGRELKISIPVMTSNTAPWGEASVSENADNAYYAFDNNSDTYIGAAWLTTNTSYLYYKFSSKKKVIIFHLASIFNINWTPNNFYLEGSNDEQDWNQIYEINNTSPHNLIDTIGIISNPVFYKYYRLRMDNVYYNWDSSHKGYMYLVTELQFYALDYSEYDWDTDDPKYYIYDHGVQLEALTLTGSVIEEPSTLKLTAQNDQASITIDTTDYVLLRGTEGQYGSGTNALICGSGSSNFGSTAGNLPYNHYLDITSINGNNATGIKQTAAGTFTCEEMWLE